MSQGQSIHGRLVDLVHLFESRGIQLTKFVLGRVIHVWEGLEPIDPEWLSAPGEPEIAGLLRFVRDAGLPPAHRPILTRINEGKPFGPGNTRWSYAFRTGSVAYDPTYRRAYTTWHKLWLEVVPPGVTLGSKEASAACAAAGFPWPVFEDFLDQVPLPPKVASHVRVRLEKVNPAEPYSAQNVHWVIVDRLRGDALALRQRTYQAWRRLPPASGATGVGGAATAAGGWGTFESFLQDVGLQPVGGRWILGKKDPAAPHGPGNTMWVAKGAAGAAVAPASSESGPAAGPAPSKSGPSAGPPESVASVTSEAAAPRSFSELESAATEKAEAFEPRATEPESRPCSCNRRRIYDPDMDKCVLCVIDVVRKAYSAPEGGA